MSPPRPFDLCAAELPLGSGRWLLEASAGTGKTYTIVGIVLRLLAAGTIRIDRAVLMTFTRAATAELRERLRQGLNLAIQVLEGQVAAGDDPLLQCLLQQHGDRHKVARRLRRALVDCDGALIATIHGFCHRLLHDHALRVGVPLAAELDGDLSAWRQRCIHDLLRDWNHRLTRAGACLVAPALDPTILQEQAQLIERQPDFAFVGSAIDAATVETRLAAVRQAWPDWRRQIVSFFEARCAVLGPDYSQRELTPVLDRIGELWDEPDHTLLEDLLRPLLDPRLSTGQRRQLAAEDWHRQLLQLMRCRYGVEQRLLEDFRDALRQRPQQQEHLHFSDLLQALDNCLAGPAGVELQRAVHERYQIALVDEFQDTDQLQWRIFKKLFSATHQRLILIGDPKQAIYGFRGADVQAYLQAAAEIPDRHRFTLATNFRSDAGLVQATNALFDRGPTTFVDEGIPFRPVDARHGQRFDDPGHPAALQIWWHPFAGRVQTVRRDIADHCAAEIARLLQDARRQDGAHWRQLRPPDIAVLVTSHRQGDLIAEALRRLPRPLASVRNLRTSIFTTSLASDVAQVLGAVLAPHQERRIRSAAVSRIGGLVLADLTDPTRTGDRERIMLRLRELRLRWREEGFAVAWQAILDQGIGLQPARVLAAADSDGERTLTDLLHLGDLLTQTVAEQGLGPDAVVHWLESRIAAPAFDDEEQHLRLERDDDAVRIMTIHGSKGLEFPVAFAPFLWSSPRPDDSPLINEGGHWKWYVAPIATDGARHRHLRAAQRRNALAESLRLAYVACTRARHRCYLSFTPQPTRGRHHGCSASPLTWLAWAAEQAGDPGQLPELLGDQIRQEAWQQAVQAGLRCDGHDQVQLTIDPPPPLGKDVARSVDDRSTATPTPDDHSVAVWHSPRRRRFFSSYSGLIRNRPVEEPDYDQLRLAGSTGADDPATGMAAPSAMLPRGPRFGSALHQVLELIDFAADEAAILQQCRLSLVSHGLASDNAPALTSLITDVLLAPLPDRPETNLRRCAEHRLAELEVLLPAVGSGAIATVFATYGGRWADYADDLTDLRIPPGFFVGIIDLIFVDQGRFHILDWKSNDLAGKGGYGHAALAREMRHHHYVLQYHLYLVALQRYLRLRLPDYDAEQHLGSAYYLFVRGVGSDGDDPSAGWYIDRPDQAMIDKLDACFGGVHG